MSEQDRCCRSCGFFSQWLPSAGDCLLKPYTRRHMLLTEQRTEPPQGPADMQGVDDTCRRWATPDEVREFVHGGQQPTSWKDRAA